MWNGVVESGKYITIYYDISGFVKDLKRKYQPITAHRGILKGFEGLTMGYVILGYGYTFPALKILHLKA